MAQEIEVYWSNRALRHLDEIYERIEEADPLAAKRFVERLEKMVDVLRVSPALGRMVPEVGRPEVRERIYQRYRLIYRMSSTEVEIIAVWHSARESLPEL